VDSTSRLRAAPADAGARPGAGRQATFPVGRRAGATLGVLTVLFLAAHLPFLARTLDDIDSINFALGIRHFDPVAHQPHPPGYPVIIGLGKIATGVLDRVSPDSPAATRPPRTPPARQNAAVALAFWSVVFGALGLFPLAWLFASLGVRAGPVRHLPGGRDSARGGGHLGAAIAATLVTACCPLFWFTAVRPMSDVPGLAAALLAQATLAAAFVQQRAMRTAPATDPAGAMQAQLRSGRLIVVGAFVAAIAIGFRSQGAWLTVPLLVLVLFDRAGRGAAAALLGSIVTFTAGVALWAVPLVVASGGPARYLRALGTQAGEDLGGVDLLMLNPTARRAAFGLIHTFILPWSSTPIAVAVIALSVIGVIAMLFRERAALVLLAFATVPYAAFHLLAQETITTRYALPLVPATAYLAVRGLQVVFGRAAPIAASALAAACLVVAVPAVTAYSAAGAPLFAVLADMEREAAAGHPSGLGLHHVFARGVEAAAPSFAPVLAARPKHEWLELVRFYEQSGSGKVWFLSDPKRTDLALIDPAARRLVRAYDWPFRAESVMSGARPGKVEWIEIENPGWLAKEGWALTPETAGVAKADGKGPARAPIEALVRPRDTPWTLLVGGRNLGDAGVEMAVAVGDRPAIAWQASPVDRFFVRFAQASALAGAGPYQTVRIEARSLDQRIAAAASIEQFNLQPTSAVVFGFGRGWQEPEYNASEGRSWRWTSGRSVLLVRSPKRDLLLRISGESPLRYYDRAPRISIRAGQRPLGRFTPAGDFVFEVPVPADVLAPEGDLGAYSTELTIETDLTFVPDERTRNGDKRRLGLRIYTVAIAGR
jgi:hypothetical protein